MSTILDITFGYDFMFWLIKYGLTVLQKGLKIGPSERIKCLKPLSFRGLHPLDPHQGPYSGALDPTPIYALLPMHHFSWLFKPPHFKNCSVGPVYHVRNTEIGLFNKGLHNKYLLIIKHY